MDGMNTLNILFSAAGRRVSLLRSFRKAMDELNIDGEIFAGDSGASAPTLFSADRHLRLLRVDDPNYISVLLEQCKNNDISLVISLIDSDLVLLSQNKALFLSHGIRILVCDEKTNIISFDKLSSYHFFTENAIQTPRVYNSWEVSNISDDDFPLMIKPWDGSCSIGVQVVKNKDELYFYMEKTHHAMAQSLIFGDEYTCDTYVDFNGVIRCVVPRRRIETRAGEVSKGVTVNDPVIIDAVIDCVSKLPHAIGCMTVQCFKTYDGDVSFIEINPRFGGGHPLTIESGADFPKWILQEVTTGICDANFEGWKNDLAMLRYDDAIFVQGKSIL